MAGDSSSALVIFRHHAFLLHVRKINKIYFVVIPFYTGTIRLVGSGDGRGVQVLGLIRVYVPYRATSRKTMTTFLSS